MAKVNPFAVVETRMISPTKIRLVDKFRGRRNYIDDDSIEALAQSLKTEGQQQPIQVRAVDGSDEVECIFGNSRVLAGMRIMKGRQIGEGEKAKHIAGDPDFKLRCEVVECSDEEAVKHNMVENAQRNQTNWVDDMYNHATLRDEHNMSDAAITKLFGYGHQASVTNLKKIYRANLPDVILQAGERGDLTLSAALTLVNASDVCENQDNILAVWGKVKSDGDEASIGTAQMKAAIRAWQAEQAEKTRPTPESIEDSGDSKNVDDTTPETLPAPPKALQLSIKEVKDVLANIGGDPRCPDKVKEIVEHMLALIAGTCEPKTFVRVLMNATGEVAKDVEYTPSEDGQNMASSDQPEPKRRGRKPKSDA